MWDHPTPDSTRRADVPASPVRLSDGSDWGFLRPSVRLQPRVVSDRDDFGRPIERIAIDHEFGYPPDVRSLVAAVDRACAEGSIVGQYDAFFALAKALLRRAHDLGSEAACALLSVSEPELPRLVRDVMAIVRETGPTGSPHWEGSTLG